MCYYLSQFGCRFKLGSGVFIPIIHEYECTAYIHTYIQTNVYSAKNRENESEALTIISTLGPTF